MRQHVVLDKKDFGDFIKKLARLQKVVAPVRRGMKNYAFEEVKSAENITLKYIPTILPPKKYFMPQAEKLIEYGVKENKWEAVLEYEKLIIFGVHTCDLAGIQCLNMVFTDKPKDINYIVRKNRVAIIGFECNEYCDEYASCKVMNNHFPNGGYDLFFTDLGGYFMVHINTLLGESFVEETGLFKKPGENNFKELEALRAEKRRIFKDEVDVKHEGLKPLFGRSFASKIWEDLDKRCVACGNCTNVCPTCYCFDVSDDIDLDLNAGARSRKWDSCQNEDFAKVAGGESFREERANRQRHRYMRKFNYPIEKYSRYFCTGCGRCSRTCMAGIKLKETINSLAKDGK
ncbi:MAG: 4Fe-4S dicluster domain-containing protein [Candidatus Omnitrophica bacterium]|nr:4Fe-4S dicluster domain-containing protein [Candidatus Omnitrophota bacterium]